ncbi:DUF4012 domain-containing protein [Cellulomonas sp. ATA003]|uniref:DUF4012 domain-containing protein n=1 Tax=Cellulomonas sp. ATA003 TaxID=3073064 RepID=UPI002872D501|nr:DUF4012 domain-containing protein [Cellulomonas sp. ATA003]WNB85215.1 DUF4012 domain-containing protein [Cellulomonas sp. ATA003]
MVLLVALGCVGWLAVDALRARDALLAAASGVSDLQTQVLTGDRAAADATLSALQNHAATARARTHGPHWALAAAMPEVGPSVRAVQTVSDIVDGLTTRALPPLMDAAALVDPTAMAPVDGRIDLAPLVAAAPGVVAADAAVRDALVGVRGIDASGVVGPVAAQLADLDSQLADVAATTATAARAIRLLPPMLGADGPREYLLLVQNNAEPRATGGIPGSVVLLRAVDGAVEVVDQRSGGSLGSLPAPVVPLTTEEEALFGVDLAADMRDVTFTPDFPRSGELARAIWAQEVGTDVDGVLSLDPGALAHVLGAIGPVPLADGRSLTAENAVELLLNTVYREVEDPEEQDDFFAATATGVFDALVSGQGEPAAVVEALARSAAQGRLMVWSAHPEEQGLLAGTSLSGELLGEHLGEQGTSPVLGVYLNDGSAAKMGYYLRRDVVVQSTECAADGTRTLTASVTLTSTAPADAADLPPYLTGALLPPGEVRANVLVYAPLGGYVDSVRVNGADAGVFSQRHHGLAVVGRTVQLEPGESVQIDLDVVAAMGQTGDPVVRTTPLASGDVQVLPGHCS